MRTFLTAIILIWMSPLQAQQFRDLGNERWQFRQSEQKKWLPAKVPGNVYSDLIRNKLIPDPFYRNQEYSCYRVDSVGWEYKTIFNADSAILSAKHIDLVFDGLDTYAEVYLNKKKLFSADNMFRQWSSDIRNILKRSGNELIVIFRPALLVTDSIAYTKKPLTLPDNSRVYARKAQFQFGWDWGPRFINAGIWKKVWIDAYQHVSVRQAEQQKKDRIFKAMTGRTELVQEPDSAGRSFYFRKNGKPVYAMGANWIPANIFLTEIRKEDYRRLLTMAKEANMNMLRVWGGGIYEDDSFYSICDELGIMVWQDFMFAGGMVPGDESFFSNVREEIRQQVLRLRHHPSIVLWCGNNEIDEAWHNWGWQQQFNLHGEDSARMYRDYQRLFEDSIRAWVTEFDGTRPYVPTSPLHGWGRKESLAEGDSHYWGLWWGMEDWEMFYRKTGRFVSEYGMQSMPNMATIESFTAPEDRQVNSPVINSHQKASQGFGKLNHYLARYMIDSPMISRLSLDEYRYLTQCLQAYILGNSIAVHRSRAPYNMGTLLWQLNDCWPVTSWSIIDSKYGPKAAWYAVKKAYSDANRSPAVETTPKTWNLGKPVFDIQKIKGNSILIRCNTEARYVELYMPGKDIFFDDNYFHLRPGETRLINIRGMKLTDKDIQKIRVRSYADILSK